MASDHDDQSPAQYASPPCFMHELDPEFRAAPADWPDVRRWRKAERERLINARLAVSADARAAMSERIAEGLDAVIGEVTGRMVSLYWPFRGEPDLRPWMASVNARGGRTALPIAAPAAVPITTRPIAAAASAAVRAPPDGITVESQGVARGSSQRAAAAPTIMPMTLPRLAKNPRAMPAANAMSRAAAAMMSTMSTG